MNKNSCSASDKAVKTVFACSGAADLGEISDLVARRIHKEGSRQMKCLAFIGAGITEMIDSVKDSDMLVIDGCRLDCGRLTMEKEGLSGFHHLRLTDLGYIKGQTEVNKQLVNEITKHALSIQ